MKNSHGLTLKQTRYLISLVFLALVFKVITPKDIVIKNNSIETILNISFENGKIILRDDLYSNQITHLPEIVSDKMVMSDEWEKYLTTLRKA
jgi:hypothetical protein